MNKTSIPVHKCPIPGCNHTYGLGTVGWYKHVMSPQVHPFWHTEMPDPTARALTFREEFPEFFPKPASRPASGTHTIDLDALKDLMDELRRALNTTALNIKLRTNPTALVSHSRKQA